MLARRLRPREIVAPGPLPRTCSQVIRPMRPSAHLPDPAQSQAQIDANLLLVSLPTPTQTPFDIST